MGRRKSRIGTTFGPDSSIPIDLNDDGKPTDASTQAAMEELQKSRDKTSQVQEQVDEVTRVMENNVNKTLERGEQLEDLEAKTARLDVEAQQFNKNAAQVEKNLKWKQMRRAIIICVVVIVVLAVAGGIAAIMMKKKK